MRLQFFSQITADNIFPRPDNLSRGSRSFHCLAGISARAVAESVRKIVGARPRIVGNRKRIFPVGSLKVEPVNALRKFRGEAPILCSPVRLVRRAQPTVFFIRT